MFTITTPPPIKPSGELVSNTRTTGATCRYRSGLNVRIYLKNGTYRLFIDGQFVAGWRQLADTYAAKY